MIIPKPSLILSISAHWVIQEGTAVTATDHPRTIHDFYGFPPELYRIEYPAPGSLEGAKLVGKELSPLRERGVLILGSGNLVHNLMLLTTHAKPFPWAVEFDTMVKNNLIARDYDALIDYTRYPISSLAHPTSEHYLPLLCIIGAAVDDRPAFFTETIFAGSVSMRGVVFGLGHGERI